MKNNKIKSLTLGITTALGLSLIASSASAQGWWGGSSHGSSCSGNTLRSDVITIDRVANQMVCQFSREMNCRCRNSVTLMNHLKKNKALTRNLVTALNGNCKCAFKKAACAVNTNMKCLVSSSRRVNLSCSMRSQIGQSATLALRIHRNADQFVPRNAYSNRGYSRPAPVQDPYANVFSSFLRSFNR